MKFFAPNSAVHNFFWKYLSFQNLLTENISEADFLVLPFMYEVIYDYSKAELESNKIAGIDLLSMKELANDLDQLSVQYAKPLLVFFYRDPSITLPFRNAIIFRTSGYVSENRGNEWGLPAFVEHKPFNKGFQARKKLDKPRVSFRGKAAPLKLPLGVNWKMQFNDFFFRVSGKQPLKNFQPNGYLLRRKALLSCLRIKEKMILDFDINPLPSVNYEQQYVQSFRDNDYFLCAAGFGNYSFRLYETIREGRIPVFVYSDDLLPCADVLDWQKLTLWVPQDFVHKTGEMIFDFHQQIHPDDFEALQQGIYETYRTYLTEDGFSAYLLNHFLRDKISHFDQ